MLRTPIATAVCALLLGLLQDPAADRTMLGVEDHRFAWVDGWGGLPEGMAMGNTHGCMAVDRSGRIYANTDSKNAVLVFEADGRFVKGWGEELAGGLHGMVHRAEEGGEFLYLAHTGRHEVLKTTLDGEVVWTLGWPEDSGLYADAGQYRPTGVAVAPNGDVYVADGYGRGYVHHFDAERRWVRSWGGPGSEPGQFRTPHGIWLDTRADEPALIVADRENHRLQVFTLDGELLRVIEPGLRRPCTVYERDGLLAVADLAGRVSLLGADEKLIAHLGDNPDPKKRANNGVPVEQWERGHFLAPHGVAIDGDGALYVLDWNARGRLTKLEKLP